MIDVNKAKQKILDLAIRGKLTKQLKSDGDAADLLVEIQKEKAKLIKDKIIRNDTNVISDDIEEPFEIPENWVWCKLGNIGRWGSGATPLTSNLDYYNNGTIPWILTGDLNDDYISNASHYITEKALCDCSLELREKGSVLIAMYGATIGRLAILKIEAAMNQACCACTVYSGINNKYLFLYLLFNKKKFINEGSGGAQPNISKEKIIKTIIPLPPLAEQIRIVEKVEQLFDILDKIDEAQKKYQKDKEILKSKIIEAGIRGKLTKQLELDGNASDLLDEIRKEKEKLIKEGKIKRDKKETYIYKNPKDNLYYEKYQDGTEKCIQDELPFEIPDNWVWCRQEDVCMLYNGVLIDKEELPYLEARVIRGQKTPLIINKGVKVRKEEYVILVDGENSGEIMRVPYDGYMGSTFKILFFYKKDISDFVKVNIELEKQELKDNKTGSAIPHLNKKIFREKIIPLPPLAEQERIINIVEKLLAYIDD